MIPSVSVVGPAIVDVLAYPFSKEVINRGTFPLDEIRLSFGGNALNEAVVLGRLGIKTELLTKTGDDEAGERVRDFAKKAGVITEHFITEPGLVTGINIVLIDESKERYFLTNPRGSLRKLSLDDVVPYIDTMADVVCFPCMFTSPLLGISEVTEMFSRIKKNSDRKLFLDMTTPKNGETIDDMKELFSFVDVFMPNEKELGLLSKGTTVEETAKKILSFGAKNVVVKRGGKDTLIFTQKDSFNVPVYKKAKVKDTTGAGDSFGAGLIYGIVKGMELNEAVCFANATASCAVEAVGATDGIGSAEAVYKRFEEYSGKLDI